MNLGGLGGAGGVAGKLRYWSDWLQANGVDLLISAVAAVAVYLLLVGVRALLRRAIGRPDRFQPHSWREFAARILQKTRSFFLAAVAAELVTLTVSAPAKLRTLVGAFVTVAVVVQGAIWVRELVIAIIARRAGGSGEDRSMLNSAMGVVSVLVSIAIWALALILILDNLGVNVTALVAGLGIGGIAIGLAAQGIFSDLFAALAILFDKPFRRGDFIAIDSLVGAVEAIGLKTTRLRALSGEQVVVSNAKLLDNRIHNYAKFRRRRVVLAVGVIYQTPPETLAGIPAEIKRMIEAHDNCTFDRCHIWNFGDSSIDIETVFFVESPEYKDMMDARQSIMLNIVRRFAELGVDFAYPTQTTFTAAPDGRMVLPYPEVRMVATEALEKTEG